jgi:hypothetical protein
LVDRGHYSERDLQSLPANAEVAPKRFGYIVVEELIAIVEGLPQDRGCISSLGRATK